MNNTHLNERQLQRYLNRMCTELEFNKMGKHIHGCTSCRTRLHSLLEMELLLDQMPLLAAPPKLEDRIMKSIYADAGADIGKQAISSVIQKRGAGAVNRYRSELVNGFIAVAATYLFINSGIIGKIISINADSWGADVQNRVAAIESVVTRISIQLLS
ncbi:hypothetical protein GC093_05290 [Paenibacillus sp. LMG 31456]|uniref:Zinc-finger domain-containing protein n=1 Tax=Paenibacillus foliorum TaxID=2654974 RepID=A0A972GKX8_9BACL|nr:hypothetical protein [Paenibacillus foliorum]NOU92644.1 hypothetical protein [Paenibacillus foliorum]